MKNGGEASFEWPSNHSCWALGLVTKFTHQHQCYTTTVGSKRFACTSHRLAIGLQSLEDQMIAQFHQDQPFDVEQGGASAALEKIVIGSKQGGEADQPHNAPYSLALCRTILSSLFGYDNRVYMMPCKTAATHQDHREKSIELDGFELSPNGISFEIGATASTDGLVFSRAKGLGSTGVCATTHPVQGPEPKGKGVGSPGVCATTHPVNGPAPQGDTVAHVMNGIRSLCDYAPRDEFIHDDAALGSPGVCATTHPVNGPNDVRQKVPAVAATASCSIDTATSKRHGTVPTSDTDDFEAMGELVTSDDEDDETPRAKSAPARRVNAAVTKLLDKTRNQGKPESHRRRQSRRAGIGRCGDMARKHCDRENGSNKLGPGIWHPY